MVRVNSRKLPDSLTVEAIKRGYPARSVFKLEEIQKKWHPIKKNKPVLDIGASPGSWSLYVLKMFNVPVSAVDLKPLTIKAPAGTHLRFYHGNIFSSQVADFLAEGSPYGTVMSDAAPSTTGNRLVDTGKSFDLVMKIIDLCPSYLSEGGNLVFKLFQGEDREFVFERMENLFGQVQIFKPKAVRKNSMELYMIGLGLKKSPI